MVANRDTGTYTEVGGIGTAQCKVSAMDHACFTHMLPPPRTSVHWLVYLYCALIYVNVLAWLCGGTPYY